MTEWKGLVMKLITPYKEKAMVYIDEGIELCTKQTHHHAVSRLSRYYTQGPPHGM